MAVKLIKFRLHCGKLPSSLELMKTNIAILAVILSFTSPSGAQTEGVWGHAKAHFSDAFDKTGMTILGLGAVATLIAFNNDGPAQGAWINHQRMSESTADLGDFWGTGIPAVTIAVGQLIFDSENGIPAAEGLLSGTLVTYGLKMSTKRPRPGTGTQTSFPSGHSQISFASATTLLMSYGWKASLPAYLMAGLTGLSRMADNAHWLSDVVAGATIGILFGRAGFKHHMAVSPMALDDGGRGGGILVTFKF
jgi:membrane-associated phospholipid phosphatase